MLPSVESQHPVGYSKVVKVVPECSTVNLDNYASCLAGSKMLESSSPQLATVKFTAHWEESVFGYSERMKHSSEARHDITGSLVYGSVQADAVAEFKRISIPVLRYIYNTTQNAYTRTMASQIDLIEASSKSSFDTFREIHTEALSRISQ